jgi:ABC transporter related
MISVEDLSFSYGENSLLSHLDFKVGQGECVLISGANGSGKSTFLKLLLGELSPSMGQVRLFGVLMPNEAILAKVGYVPQLQTMKQVTLPITVEEFIVFGLYRSFGYLKVPRKKDYVRVAQALEEFGLKAYQKAKFNTLSGGLKQRVMLMRAILQTPKLYIFDEPTVGVDKESKKTFFTLLTKLRAEGKTIVMVSHEINEIKLSCPIDAHYELREGRLGRCLSMISCNVPF